MKVYLAGRYSRRDEFIRLRTQLNQAGIEVTSRWLNEKTPLHHVTGDLTAEYMRESAAHDLEDIDAADAVVFFAEDQNRQPPRGGRHVEFGYALAKGKQVYVVGAPENIFHSLPLVSHYASFAQVGLALLEASDELRTKPTTVGKTDDGRINFGGKTFKSITGPLPDSAAERKKYPMYRGLLKYFPDALAEVAHLSYVGNEQHNPGQPLHWAREKSTDQEDTIIRHLLQSGEVDVDGVRHSVKVAWRALALAQLELEKAKGLNGDKKGSTSSGG